MQGSPGTHRHEYVVLDEIQIALLSLHGFEAQGSAGVVVVGTVGTT